MHCRRHHNLAALQKVLIGCAVRNETKVVDPVSQGLLPKSDRLGNLLELLAAHDQPERDSRVCQSRQSLEKLSGVLVMLPAVIPQ